jgi:hypothetical protein
MWYAALLPQAVNYLSAAEQNVPPTGPGYVVTLVGEHFHNNEEVKDGLGIRADYVANTLLKNLKLWTAQQTGTPTPVPVGQIGISHPVIIEDYTTQVPDPRNFTELKIDDGNPFGRSGPAGSSGAYPEGGGEYLPAEQPMAFGPAGGHGGGSAGGTVPFGPAGAANRASIGAIINQPNQPTTDEMRYEPIDKTSFTVQFVWRPTAQEDRTEKRPEPTEEAATAAKAAVEAVKAAVAGPAGSEGMSGEH